MFAVVGRTSGISGGLVGLSISYALQVMGDSSVNFINCDIRSYIFRSYLLILYLCSGNILPQLDGSYDHRPGDKHRLCRESEGILGNTYRGTGLLFTLKFKLLLTLTN